MSEITISAEMARAEFDRFAEAWDLDTDTASMEEEDRKGFEDLRRRLERKISSGSVAIDDGGTLSFTLSHPKSDTLSTLIFGVPTGNAILAWDKYKDRQQIHKINAFLGACTGQSPAIFAKMDGRDLKVCQAVVQLFLGS